MEEEASEATKSKDSINEAQVYDLITGEEVSWQSIIYDLIKTEQLDPWNIDIGTLADKYLETVQEMEEEHFYVSSKVLLACSLLLRLKTDILANSYIQELNDALFGRKEVQRTLDLEQYIVDERELPLLVPKSPMARHKKVTLDELMSALNKAMNTENRRIKRTIKQSQAKKAAEMVLPKSHFIPLKVRIKKILGIIKGHLGQKDMRHIEFTKLADAREEKLAAFLPILHLSNDKHIHTYQPIHFEEIFITDDMHPEDHKLMHSELELYSEE